MQQLSVRTYRTIEQSSETSAVGGSKAELRAYFASDQTKLVRTYVGFFTFVWFSMASDGLASLPFRPKLLSVEVSYHAFVVLAQRLADILFVNVRVRCHLL